MSRKTAWVLGIGGSGLVAYGVWRAWRMSASLRADLPWAEEGIDSVHEASDESFPASDAPSHTPMMGSRVKTVTS
jgi:hypothetical protein